MGQVFNSKLGQGEEKLKEEYIKVVWAEFSTLSLAVFVLTEIVWHRQARARLELKTRPRSHPIGLSILPVHDVSSIIGNRQPFSPGSVRPPSIL